MEKFRIQVTQEEVWQIRNTLVSQYHCDRANIRYHRQKIAKGIERDSIMYPLEEREKHLKKLVRLLKKLSRYHTEKWFIR